MIKANSDLGSEEINALYDRIFDYVKRDIVGKVEGLRLGDYDNGTGHPPFMIAFLGGSKFDDLGEPTDNPRCYYFEFPESFEDNPNTISNISLNLNQIMSGGKKLIDLLSDFEQEIKNFRIRAYLLEKKGYDYSEINIDGLGGLSVKYPIPTKTEEDIKKVLGDFLVY